MTQLLVPQPGIFAQGTRSHHHLELSVRPGASDADVLAALAQLREPQLTAGGVNLVIGFGPALWGRLAPSAVPEGFHDYPTIDGLDGKVAPGTQRDIWVWVHGTGEDVAFDTARLVGLALAPVATVELDIPSFVYKDSRDLTGFIDGTANPPTSGLGSGQAARRRSARARRRIAISGASAVSLRHHGSSIGSRPLANRPPGDEQSLTPRGPPVAAVPGGTHRPDRRTPRSD